MYYNDSDQARESGLRRAFVESMQELMKCVNTLVAGAAEKAYCYLNLCGMDVFTGCFFVDRDGKASLAPALLGEKQRIFETVMTTQARKLRGAYIEYADDIPGEFFLDFDIGAKKPPESANNAKGKAFWRTAKPMVMADNMPSPIKLGTLAST